jgi:methyltransferase (TIGR00027 family)
MAFFRAVESSRPAGERLFHDPLAATFLSLPLRGVLLPCRTRPGRAAVVGVIEWRWGGPLGSAVCRTRYIDDALGAALDGVGQVVVLGAGFDVRALRVPGIARTRVFEVDHPATQAAKRARLARVKAAIPAHVTFVPVDFGRDRLEDAMARAGFSPSARTFFLWEGVTNYLTAEAVDRTIGWVARAGAPGSLLLFTYVHRGLIDGSVPFEGARAGSRTVRRFGEPYTFGFDPAELRSYLAEHGLELVEDVGAPEYRARYLLPAGRKMKLWEFYRAVIARVI